MYDCRIRALCVGKLPTEVLSIVRDKTHKEWVEWIQKRFYWDTCVQYDSGEISILTNDGKASTIDAQGHKLDKHPYTLMPLPISIKELLCKNVVESSRIEFKKTWNHETIGSIIRTICAFANDFDDIGGGYIVIGIEEADGVMKTPIVGLDARQLDSIQKEVWKYCQMIFPVYLPKLSVEKIREANIIVLWVPSGEDRPYRVVKNVVSKETDKAGQKYYIRYASTTREATGNNLTRLLMSKNRVPFDERGNSRIKLADISYTLIRDHLVKVGSELADGDLKIEELLERMGLMTGPSENRQIKNVAAMMFCEHPEKFFDRTWAEIVIFPEGRIENPDNIIELPPIHGSVPVIISRVLDYFKVNVIQETIIKPQDRAESIRYFNYPYQAIEESVVNAFYHRDYQVASPVEITIEPHQISVLSCTGPDSSIPDHKLRLAECIPSRQYRNRRLGDFLKELKLTEARATGFPTIQRELRRNGSSRARIETDSERTFFRIEIPCRTQGSRNAESASGENLMFHMRQIFQRAVARGKYTDALPDDRQLELMIRALRLMSEPLSMAALLKQLGDIKRTTAQRVLILPLLTVGLIEMTIPSSLKSSRQKYVATTAAAIFLNS